MGKNVLIPIDLLCDVLRLLCYLVDDSNTAEIKRLRESIEAQISYKLKKMELRKTFSVYKAAPPGPERESLRREYITQAQIHKDFVSSHEIHDDML